MLKLLIQGIIATNFNTLIINFTTFLLQINKFNFKETHALGEYYD
jgi:hypothetical protein